ncbi:unnamed protein product [Linum trigynum]
MYGESQLCAATVVLYCSCILLPLRQLKQRVVGMVVRLLFGSDCWYGNGPLVIDSWVAACSRMNVRRLLAAEAAPYKEEEEAISCSICLGELRKGRACQLRRCNHAFHVKCIERWVERAHYTCPLCRTSIFASLT